jgi:hypothetical protein
MRLEIFGPKTRVLGDAGEHSRSHLFAVVKGEGEIGVSTRAAVLSAMQNDVTN